MPQVRRGARPPEAVPDLMAARKPKPPPSPFDHWTEVSFQNRVERLALKHDWLYYHPFNSRKSRKGFPDTVMVHPGRQLTIYAELKSLNGKPSPDQQKWLEGLAAAGEYVFLWYPRHWPAIQDILSGVEDPVRPSRRRAR